MKKQWWIWISLVASVGFVLLNMQGIVSLIHSRIGQQSMQQTSVVAAIRQEVAQHPPVPFLHRPYYGNRTILQRTISFMDHDKPWYVDDGLFVRFDGNRWDSTLTSCQERVNCYDGHNGYDLDLWYEPVLSAAAGTVIRANWYNPIDHNSSFGLWVAIDHGNGFVTAYGHLSAITVAVGDQVGTQWQIGTSGTTGSSTGPHLHMSTYYLPYWQATDPFGWDGNYPDPNPVPDNYLWVNQPGTGGVVPNLSTNGTRVYPGSVMVDDSQPGWSSTGNWTSTRGTGEIDGTLHWTATSDTYPNATATWRPTIPRSGNYEVGVFVDATHASSGWVPYSVYSAAANNPYIQLKHTVYVDESHIGVFQGPFGTTNTGPQWVSLGTYFFRQGTSGYVSLNNATGESGAQIAADGVEFTPV